MNNVLIVTNSSAGRKQAIKQKKKLQKILLRKRVNFRFVNIDKFEPLEIEEFDTIIVIGGDGTVNKVLPYMIGTDKILGIIPTGTANLLAAKLKIKSVKQALKILDKENSTKIDLLRINRFLSILRCGLGFDADIIGKTPQTMKNKFGYFSYFIAGIIFALRLKNKEYIVSLNNQTRTINASCIIVANAGNMYKDLFSVAKSSMLDDGLFDVFILKTQNPILFFIELIKIMLNIKINSSIAEYLQGNSLKIKNNYCLAHIDGEKTKFTEDLNFEVVRDSINIYCEEDVCLERIEIFAEDMLKTMVS